MALVAAGCGSKHAAEADPAQATKLARAMIAAMPGPAQVRECEGPEVIGGATLTTLTLLELANDKIPDKPEFKDWINPAELDSPAIRTLIDAKATVTAKRQATAEMLAAPFYLVYRVDMVNAPIALQVKELKRGTVGARAIRYDKAGQPVCIRIFFWQNDKARSEWAIKKSDRALIDPEIAKAMRDDLKAEMLKRVSVLAQPQARGEPMERVPDGISN